MALADSAHSSASDGQVNVELTDEAAIGADFAGPELSKQTKVRSLQGEPPIGETTPWGLGRLLKHVRSASFHAMGPRAAWHKRSPLSLS